MIEKQKIIYDPKTINPRWKHYFKYSTALDEYVILTDGSTMIMSNTEFEDKTNQPLYDLVTQKGNNSKILLIGWGIGFVIPKIRDIAPNAQITVIEKYQEVLNLTPPPDDIEIILTDVNDFTNQLDEKSFDIIWSDLTEQNNREEDLKTYLKPNGVFQYWRGLCLDCES